MDPNQSIDYMFKKMNNSWVGTERGNNSNTMANKQIEKNELEEMK